MSIDWNDIVRIFLSQPWWLWVTGLAMICFGSNWLYKAAISYAERPVITSQGFKQCRVRVDLPSSTITLPQGNTYPVSSIRGLRWENFSRAGFYHAFIEVDDLKSPIHPVLFSTPSRPEEFVARLRTVVERTGCGPEFGLRPSAVIRHCILSQQSAPWSFIELYIQVRPQQTRDVVNIGRRYGPPMTITTEFAHGYYCPRRSAGASCSCRI